MRQQVAAAACIVVATAALGGCADGGPTTASTAAATASPSEGAGADSASVAPSAPPSPQPTSSTRPSPVPSPSPTAAATSTDLTDVELGALGVNELGRVLVAEWHVIGDTDGEYRTSRATLRRQLEDLHQRGYRPVTQQEFLDGTFPIPAGTSPVLLTFDDSTRGQFALDDDGTPTADSAVGIIEAFAADHPDWRATGVFGFNFPDPFGDPDVQPRLQWLVDNGYELSNHSLGHVNLANLTSAEVVANLAENQARLHEVVPDAPVPSLTLPLGIWPADRAAAVSGTDGGATYQHDLVYLVGSDPTRSPHHVEFDGAAVQRVPAHAVVGTGPEWFTDWLDRLDDEALRYVADGSPDVVTFPAHLAEVADVDPAFATRTYEAP